MALLPIADGKIYDPNNGIKATTGNYKNQYNFADQFFPDLKHELIKIWGNQNLTGFLETFGMEQMLTADTTFWSEDNRLRRVHLGVTRATNIFTYVTHSIRLNDYIMISDKAGAKVEFGIVTAVTDDTFTAKNDAAAAWTVATTDLLIISVGSEFKKGTEGKAKALTKEVSIYSTSPTIKKDMYEETGSNIPNVAWIYDTGNNPYWYIPEEQDAMYRFLDANESQMVLLNEIDAASGLVTDGYKGTKGLFPAIRERGNNFQGKLSSVSDFDSIVKRFDKVNGQQYNAMFLTTDHSLTIDDTLAAINQYTDNAANYGIFSNADQEKIMNLGFKGFRRAGYEFYKQTWKFLKDATMYNPDNFAAAKQVHGIMLPLGQTGVKNTIEGNPIEQVPFLTIMYKGKNGYSRKLVTNFHGSQLVPDATDTRDVYGIDWLSESCLRPAGMIRWMIFEGA